MGVKTIWELCLFQVAPFVAFQGLQMGILFFWTERDWSRKSCYGNGIKVVICFFCDVHTERYMSIGVIVVVDCFTFGKFSKPEIGNSSHFIKWGVWIKYGILVVGQTTHAYKNQPIRATLDSVKPHLVIFVFFADIYNEPDG